MAFGVKTVEKAHERTGGRGTREAAKHRNNLVRIGLGGRHLPDSFAMENGSVAHCVNAEDEGR